MKTGALKCINAAILLAALANTIRLTAQDSEDRWLALRPAGARGAAGDAVRRVTRGVLLSL